MRKGSANDPLRKTRIARGALDVIADRGFRTATHRTIARQAGVPLGSVAYHYSDLDDILATAFELISDQIETRYGEAIAGAATEQEARNVLANTVWGEQAVTDRELRPFREMYAC